MLSPGDRQAVRDRIRRLNDLGFAVDEIALEPASPGGEVVRLKVAVADRRFHARELERLTGIVALEGQARLLLNDLREYQTWLSSSGADLTVEEAADAGCARFSGLLSPPSSRSSGRRATRSRRTATSSS